MRMLATGANCLPARGIGAVSEQLAQKLPPGSIQLGVYRLYRTLTALGLGLDSLGCVSLGDDVLDLLSQGYYVGCRG
jgi:hypothetical protein